MSGIYIPDFKEKFYTASKVAFNQLAAGTERKGFQSLIRVVGSIDNLTTFSVNTPPEGSIFRCHEKATRTEVLGHATSQQSEDFLIGWFRGCVSVIFNGVKIQSSTSGLEPDADVVVSVMNLSLLTKITMRRICDLIVDNSGKNSMPESFFADSPCQDFIDNFIIPYK